MGRGVPRGGGAVGRPGNPAQAPGWIRRRIEDAAWRERERERKREGGGGSDWRRRVILGLVLGLGYPPASFKFDWETKPEGPAPVGFRVGNYRETVTKGNLNHWPLAGAQPGAGRQRAGGTGLGST